MVGKWIDLVVLVFLALGLLKGFKKGLIRELFSLMGAILPISSPTTVTRVWPWCCWNDTPYLPGRPRA